MTSPLVSIVDRLRNCPPEQFPDHVEAVAYGGSYSRNEQDRFSDLDLFVVLRPIDSTEIPDLALSVVDWIGRPAVLRGPVFVPHFGYSMTLVYHDLTVCQLNLNTMRTLELNPMRARSAILLDRTGALTALAAEARGLSVDIGKVYVEEHNYFWIRALYGWRSLQRGELWRTAAYLSDMRKPILQFARLRHGRYDPTVSPHTPATRLEQHIGGEHAGELRFCLPRYTAEDLCRCLRESVRWFASVADELPYHASLSDSELAVASEVARVILGAGG